MHLDIYYLVTIFTLTYYEHEINLYEAVALHFFLIQKQTAF